MIDPAEPLIHWPDPFIELLSFVASFLASGAIGFRFVVLGRLGPPAAATDSDEQGARERMTRIAAVWGLAGSLGTAAIFLSRLPQTAARHHVSVAQLVTGDRMTVVQAACVTLTLLGFALAFGRRASGWPLAALGIVGGTLRSALNGQWARLVVPLHRLAGGLWIGTLFVLLVAGVATVLGSTLTPARRGALVAEMVRAFSPFALVSAGALALFGVITAWQHLGALHALWTTPYGITLIVKLIAVIGVVSLGAWNRLRQLPQLGTEQGARSLRRSARMELAIAGLVLMITSILVSLPSPKK